MMEVGLGHLGNNVILEQSPPQRVREELILIAYAQQNTGKTGIVEIELWAFDDSLIEVPMVRREQENDKALAIYDRIVDLSKIRGAEKRVPDEEAEKREGGSKTILATRYIAQLPIPKLNR